MNIVKTKCDFHCLSQDLFYAFCEMKAEGFKQGLELALKMAQAAQERHLTPHYAESIVNEIAEKLKECK